MSGSEIQIRLALVFYGGISLAVYMNGMVQELLALIRASQARQMVRSEPDAPFVREQRATNPYYRLLEAAGVDLVVDVIAGTSAGGLNGLMLGKALAVGAPDLGTMTELWKQQAQISKLGTYDREPAALLSGQMLVTELEKVLEHLTRSGDPALARQVQVLDLFVTATDVRGHRWTETDRFRQKVEGISHKHLFHLKKRSRDPGTGRGYEQNDFRAPSPERQGRIDRLLAKIGQATSALPPAFPPVRISRAEAKEAGLSLMDDLQTPAEGTWFCDGGVLMNRPFEPVVERVVQRSTAGAAKRVLAFLDPDPRPVEAPEQTEPSLLENAVAALTLSMQQDIADDLERLNQENQRRRALQNLVEEIDEAVGESENRAVMAKAGRVPQDQTAVDEAARELLSQVAPTLDPLTPEPLPPDPPGSEVITQHRPGAGSPVLQSYYALRLSRLQEWLRESFTAALSGLELTGARLEEGVEAFLAELPWLSAPAHDPAVIAHLDRYDCEYQQRRLHFLLTRIREQFRPGVVPSDPEAMERLMHGLWGALEDWRNAAWAVAHAGRLGEQPEPWTDVAARLDQGFLSVRRAVEIGQRGKRHLRRAAAEAVSAIDQYLSLVGQRAEREVEQALGFANDGFPLRNRHTRQPLRPSGRPELTPERLTRSYLRFQSRDLILFPLRTYGAPGEWETVDLMRLSAADARGWVKRHPDDKVTGTRLQHFGAFLDERWRMNDIMWGRLDAAELLTRLVVTEAGLFKPGLTPLPGGESLPEAAYSETAQQALADRRLQIVADFPELVDLKEVRRSLQQSGAALQAEEPVPEWALQKYMEQRYRIIPDGLEGLPPQQLAGEALILLYNLTAALQRSGLHLGSVEKALLAVLRPLNWVARLILIPRKGLFGIAQGNLAALMLVVGTVLLLLHLVGAIGLESIGWGITVALLAPPVLGLLVRPKPLHLALAGTLALLSGGGALFPSGLPGWLAPFTGSWPFFLGLFGAFLIAFLTDRQMRRPT